MDIETKHREGLMSEKQAANWLGVSRITLLRARMAGRVGAYRIGARVLYSEEEHLRPFLEACEHKPHGAQKGEKSDAA